MEKTNAPPPYLPPIFLTRRRVIIACTHCRKRKIRCLTPEDPPQNPCNRCAKKGLHCEYITIADQRDESSITKSAPVESRSSDSGSPPIGSLRRTSFNASRPVDPSWDGNSQGGPSTMPPPGHSIPGSLHRFQPYRTQSAVYNSDQYNRAYQMPNLPLTMQPDPYLSRDFTPMGRHNRLNGQAAMFAPRVPVSAVGDEGERNKAIALT
ncbi:hypothetical protein K438DRAFT_1980890 [Mycena galopus ATCC 62051]|nr:hypothetical protein K438DRAFT_1980890 [Mycena galopus ATCC 62051]